MEKSKTKEIPYEDFIENPNRNEEHKKRKKNLLRE